MGRQNCATLQSLAWPSGPAHRPSDPRVSDSYTVVLRFDTQEHLEAWMQSPIRSRLIEKVQPLFADFWFIPEVTGIVVFLMVYLVMPRYTKLLHRWLFTAIDRRAGS
jgi:antibiotic biosynthesis monooxygenase (ABM) superfamily enzyme